MSVWFLDSELSTWLLKHEICEKECSTVTQNFGEFVPKHFVRETQC